MSRKLKFHFANSFGFGDDTDANESAGLAEFQAAAAATTSAFPTVIAGKAPAPTGTVFGGPIPDTGTILDALLADGKWDNSKPITYFFDDANSVSKWTEVEKAAFRSALQTWSDVANLRFEETSDINSANFVQQKFFDPSQVDLLGFSGGFPNPSNQLFFGYNVGAYVGASFADDAWAKGNFGPGGIEYWCMIHEIGHALGLPHPHDTGAGSTVLPGVDQSFYDYGDNSLNQGIYTLMSYNRGYKELFGTTEEYVWPYGGSATPMAFDIAAIQYIYGANPVHNAGNDSYFLPTSNSTGTSWVCIYDTGGVDTIINPGKAPSTISLVAATIDESPTGGGVPSYVNSVQGGFTISQNSIVENAQGGAASDTIIGNRVNNVLSGNAGNDAIFGAGGNDNLFGGAGDDTLYGDSGDPRVSGVSLGSGQILNPSGNTSFATALDITNSFSLSSNPHIANSATVPHVTISMTGVPQHWFALTVNPGSTITVDMDHTKNIDGFLLLYAPDGRGLTFNDDSTADLGSPHEYTFRNLSYSTDPELFINAVSGGTYYLQLGWTAFEPINASFDVHVSVSNPLTFGTDGTPGNDNLSGDAGSDHLFGGAGSDVLSGGSDNDVLNGGAGTDFLTGGGGDDTFVLVIGGGSDVVTDFFVGNSASHDSLELDGFGLTISQVLNATIDTPQGALIDLGSDEITLLGVTKNQLATHDDVFLV